MNAAAVITTRHGLDAAIRVLARGNSEKRWILVSHALAERLGTPPYKGFHLRVPPQKPAGPWTHAAATEIDT